MFSQREDVGLFFCVLKTGGNYLKKKYVKNLILVIAVTLISALILLSGFAAGVAEASGLPSPDAVLETYRQNPYIRFYEGTQGIAWTTIHPDGYSVTASGAYIYGGGVSIYRGNAGDEIIPAGVVSRRELQGPLPAGHHYYSAMLNNTVVPVGKWVLSHVDARCIHGPFEAAGDYEYYGINGLPNIKCGGQYDSGWIAYCADCGTQLTGLVYTNDDCVGRIGYIFAGDEDFRSKYPAEYMFICPLRGDNLENDLHMSSHVCNCFVSANRYRITYDGNGATNGSMTGSQCYYGGATEYEGNPVTGDTRLKENAFKRSGYVFAGWSDTPSGQVLFCDKSSTLSLENYFTYLGDSGDASDNKEIVLYAVWKKTDSTLNISGGSFGDSGGSYNGVVNGSFVAGSNSFSKGYLDITNVSPELLTRPNGYKVSFVTYGGNPVPDMYASTLLTGWKIESEESGARRVDISEGDIHISGHMSGKITDVYSDGGFIYVHSSEVNENCDTATAEWKSTSIVLPAGTFQGLVFDGWYTDPSAKPDTYVGKCGDLYIPESDTVLYASFSGLDMTASPDYMGNEDFGLLRYNGLTDLNIPRATEYDLYRYFISDDYPSFNWREAAFDDKGAYSGGSVRAYAGGGKYSEYIAAVSGIYTFGLWGGAGGSYGQYAGENGEYSSCRIFLNSGDVIGIYTGKAGSATSNANGSVCYGGEASYITVNGNLVMSSAGGKGASYILNINQAFDYSGSVQSYTVPSEGDYTLQVWGAEGAPTSEGRYTYGQGGYAAGTVHLTAGSTLYICIGGQNGYNGGGYGGYDAWGGHGGNGGGATHIASVNGLLSNLEGYKSSIYIVAGGGGGAGGSGASSGSGGGETGGTGISPWPLGEGVATGGTLSSPGTDGFNDICYGGFGYGGSGISYDEHPRRSAAINNGGGGGGWYGGGGGGVYDKSYGCGGGGGSGYIGGVSGGSMLNGVRSGNGYAVISCSVNIVGQNATGYGTVFAPGSLLYAGYTVKSHAECVYPLGDTSKAGYCTITEPDEQLLSSSECKIYSPDTASPDPVSDACLKYDPETGIVSVIWSMPDDNGTDYHYIARAYHSSDVLSGELDKYASTGIESLTIKTGVYAYYYVIDDKPSAETVYVRNSGSRLLSAWSHTSGSYQRAEFSAWYENASSEDKKTLITYTPCGDDRYIHIVVSDRAGNNSAVFSMAIDGEGAHIPYPIVTEDLNIVQQTGVYASPERDRTYYVRADGSTAFLLDFSARIMGYARTSYQIDTARIHRSGSEYAEFSFDRNMNIFEDCDARVTDTRYFGPFTMQCAEVKDAVRSERSARLSFTGEYTTMSEEEMYIYPTAHAHLESGWDIYGLADGIVSSNLQDDLTHGITLIGDGTAPECMVSVNGSGYVRLSECNISNVTMEYVVDRRFDDVVIDLYVSDSGAGLKEGFTVNIVNLDNGLESSVRSTGDHYAIELKMDPDLEEACFENMLFNGRFVIRVSSEDNVGNSGIEESAGLTELDVSGEIVRLLDFVSGPLIDEMGRRYIKKGESGYIVSKVWGYPDAVLVSFEDESLSKYDVLYICGSYVPDICGDYAGTVIRTDPPGYIYELNTDFTIPLDYPANSLKVTITAFKGDETVTWEAECEVISSGSVLDELMTVLR